MKSAVFASAVVLASADWEAFKAKYGKVYNGPDHEASHKKVWESNMQWAAENSNDEVTFGENQFADLTQDQYRVAAGLGYKANSLANLPHLGVHEYNGEELAESVDWTTRGAVTPVKDQGQCGSCWAFSTTGGMEGAWQIASGSLKSMSEQQLVDCSTQNSGCNGGSMELAFNFARGTNVATEASYPYKARDGSCKSSFTTAIPQGGVTGYKSVGQSTNALKSALQNGPVSVAIEADQMAFQLYSGGVLKSGCGTNLDHGVLAVGYTADAFKVKNSWGSSWGENGYLQISTSGNTCGIHSDASYPTVSASVTEPAKPATLEEMADHINSLNLSWKAEAPNKFGDFDDVKMLCGAVLRDEDGFVPQAVEKEDDGENVAIPSDFDVRTNWPDCASVSGDIRDQSACGSCWAFGSTEAFNDRYCIATGSTVLFSPTDTAANCGFAQCFSFGCGGGQPGMAWDWFVSTGVVTGGDFEDIGKGTTCGPYPFQSCAHHVPATAKHPACPSDEYSTPTLNKCSEDGYGVAYDDDKIKAASSYSLSGVENIQKDILTYGSATAAFTVYEDFPTYKSGVYRHTSGSQLGGHAIKLLGWGVEDGQDYWLVANSWNEEWGDHGTFKIVRGENHCGIEGQVSAGHATPPAAVTV